MTYNVRHITFGEHPTDEILMPLPSLAAVRKCLDLLLSEQLATLRAAAFEDPTLIQQAIDDIEWMRARPTTENIIHDYGLWAQHVDPECHEFSRASFNTTPDSTKLEVMRTYGNATDDYSPEDHMPCCRGR